MAEWQSEKFSRAHPTMTIMRTEPNLDALQGEIHFGFGSRRCLGYDGAGLSLDVYRVGSRPSPGNLGLELEI